MKRYTRLIALMLIAVLALSGCGKKEELGAWEMPVVDSKPTVAPTAMPSFGGGSPETYVWNEAEFFNMADPGAAPESLQEKYGPKDTSALFPYNFLPASIFGESYSSYDKLSFRKTNHEVMLNPEDESLAENSYVEFVYGPKSYKDSETLYVYAELLSYEQTEKIYNEKVYPHISYVDSARPQYSRNYLKDFVLAKCGEQRIAQILKLTPNSYFTDTQAARITAEQNGEVFVPQRQILLTISCGIDMSDEEFIAAVCTLLHFSDGSEKPVVEESGLPKPGEKGAA